MPYRISYIDTSIPTDGQITAGTPRTEEFPTEPAALARARELIEGVDYKTVIVSDNSGEHLGVVGIPLKPVLTAGISRRCESAPKRDPGQNCSKPLKSLEKTPDIEGPDRRRSGPTRSKISFNVSTS